MSPYRKEVEKLYTRIITLVSKGQGYLQNYFDLIDEVIEYGKSELLQDVMSTKFKIDTRQFASIDMLKKNTFKRIAQFTESNSNKNLQKLFISKGVYTIGTQFFDLYTSQYLGDIKQYDTSTNSQVLDVYTFYPTFLKIGIPEFISNPLTKINYEEGSIVYYGNNLYWCIIGYTWEKQNQITPTFSNYWMEVFPGTQSLHTIIEPQISILDRYSKSIDILREYYYIDPSNNKYTQRNYIDEYFE